MVELLSFSLTSSVAISIACNSARLITKITSSLNLLYQRGM
nr:MAG TPA: hypothetical protein [Caudoviricetes sp.]